MDKQSKKIKKDKPSRKNSRSSNKEQKEEQESRMIVRFQDSEGVTLQGSEIELSTSSSIETLTEIVKSLVNC